MSTEPSSGEECDFTSISGANRNFSQRIMKGRPLGDSFRVLEAWKITIELRPKSEIEHWLTPWVKPRVLESEQRANGTVSGSNSRKSTALAGLLSRPAS